MKDIKVKEITSYVEDSIKKTRLVISQSGKDTEIILEGNGKIKAAIEV